MPSICKTTISMVPNDSSVRWKIDSYRFFCFIGSFFLNNCNNEPREKSGRLEKKSERRKSERKVELAGTGRGTMRQALAWLLNRTFRL